MAVYNSIYNVFRLSLSWALQVSQNVPEDSCLPCGKAAMPSAAIGQRPHTGTNDSGILMHINPNN
jgi:hypothetical protein